MQSRKILIGALISLFIVNTPVLAKSTSVQELLNNSVLVSPQGSIGNDHWAYKTLENINKKYNLELGSTNEKFNLNRPLTRSEAAFLLVGLVGKIEKNKTEISDFEKGQLDSVKNELQQEISELKVSINKLDSSVTALQGRISNLEQSDQKNMKYGFGEKFKLNGGFALMYNGNFNKSSRLSEASTYPPNFSIPVTELTVSGKLAPHINYLTQFFPHRNFTSTSTRSILGTAYASTDIIPHHVIQLGQTMVPIGKEGPQSPYTLDFTQKAMIARKLSNYRDIGIKATGNWNFVDYYLGAYNGNANNAVDTNRGMDVASWVNFKPLYKHLEFGNLDLGGGYSKGKNQFNDHDSLGFYAGYKYNKYAIKSEYAFSKGSAFANNMDKSSGFYITNTYDLTKKLQLAARYDQYDPNIKIGHNLKREYTTGINYLLSGNNLKLQLNYIYNDDQKLKESNKFAVYTQYTF